MCKASKLRTCGRELESQALLKASKWSTCGCWRELDSQAPDPSPELRLVCAWHSTHLLTVVEEDESGHALDVICFRSLSVVIHINLQV
jgi:hypothetical protein